MRKRINNQICVPRSWWLEFEARVEVGTQGGLTVTQVRDGGGLAQDGGSKDEERWCVSFVMQSQGRHDGIC